MARAFGGQLLARSLELLARFLLRVAKACEARLRFAHGGASLLRLPRGQRERVFRAGQARFEREAFLLDGHERCGARLFGGGVARGGFFRLQRFGLLPRRFLDEAAREAAQLFHASFEAALLGGARGNIFGRFAQARFERGGLAAERGDGFLLRGHARGEIGYLARGLLDFHGEARGARFELRGLLAIERDAIFGAIEIEGGLAEKILRLAQLGVEFVGAVR